MDTRIATHGGHGGHHSVDMVAIQHAYRRPKYRDASMHRYDLIGKWIMKCNLCNYCITR